MRREEGNAVRSNEKGVSSIRAKIARLLDYNIFDVATGMTLALLLFATTTEELLWYLRLSIYILVVAAIIYRPLTRNALYWFAITLILCVGLVKNWQFKDNHSFLIMYWCLAIGASLITVRAPGSLAHNARLLIGWCFLFAVISRFLSPDFLDGTFFHYALLEDVRMELIAKYVGNMPESMLQQNKTMHAAFMAYENPQAGLEILGNARVAWLAKAITWWVIIIETAIAIIFLWPQTERTAKWRDGLLLAFMFGTYILIPIVHYGWVLIAMGVAQSHPKYSIVRFLYGSLFILLLVYRYFIIEPVFG